ncbi:hypothetical protein [Nocardia flavorosea]|uniref:hypothetical protein n=1 Tax=Nocardia flavorosea TaxID=53429 RepID=UPI00245608BF|nr:hypothetical protein [Nocardia flavorosea]
MAVATTVGATGAAGMLTGASWLPAYTYIAIATTTLAIAVGSSRRRPSELTAPDGRPRP